MSTQKEDLRVRKTKKALYEAFLSLLSQKPYEEITVNELCDAAGVRRATFYKHYTDKLGFLTAYTRSLRDKFDTTVHLPENSAPDKDYYVSYAKRMVSFVSENISAIENIIESDLFPFVLSVILEQNYKDTCIYLEKSVKEGMKLRASVNFIASICAGGAASVIYTWLKNGRVQSEESVAEELGILISSLIGEDS